MRLMLAGLLGSALLSAASANAENLRVTRLDDTIIDAYVDRQPSKNQQSILLTFQGSNCSTVAPGGDRLPVENPPSVALLHIEKYAVTSSTKTNACPAAYLANNTIDGRVIDALTVIAHLRAKAPWWNRRLYLAGASEGAVVAAITAGLAPETMGVILINGPVGQPFREGWTELMVDSVRSGGGDGVAQDAAREEATKTWAKARATPTTETFFGDSNTLRWWASIIDLRASNLLVNVDAPILLMQSEMDKMSPPAAARALVDRFKAAGKTNLVYKELPGLDHGLRDPQGKPAFGPVLRQASAFLASLEAGRDRSRRHPRQ